VSFGVFRPDELDFDDRGDWSGRTLAGVSDRLTQTRALSARGAGSAARRVHPGRAVRRAGGNSHDGPGDPPERVELPRGSVCAVQPGTALQVRNDGVEDVLPFIIGAPPEQGEADYFPDVG
jgi:hypothetical protein